MWIEKSDNNTFWVLLLFLLLFYGIRLLYQYNIVQTRHFIRLFNFSTYLRIYGNERDISFKKPFLLVLYLLSIGTYSLFCCIIMAFYNETDYSISVFFSAIGILFAITLSRYLLASFLGWLFEIESIIRWILFRTLSYYAILASAIYILSVFFVFGAIDNKTFLIQLGLGLILVSNLLIQVTTYYLAIKRHPQNAFYLFLYICLSKIAPWIWIYKAVYKSVI